MKNEEKMTCQHESRPTCSNQ